MVYHKIEFHQHLQNENPEEEDFENENIEDESLDISYNDPLKVENLKSEFNESDKDTNLVESAEQCTTFDNTDETEEKFRNNEKLKDLKWSKNDIKKDITNWQIIKVINL